MDCQLKAPLHGWCKPPDTPGNSRTLPDTPGNSRKEQRRSKSIKSDCNPQSTVPPSENTIGKVFHRHDVIHPGNHRIFPSLYHHYRRRSIGHRHSTQTCGNPETQRQKSQPLDKMAAFGIAKLHQGTNQKRQHYKTDWYGRCMDLALTAKDAKMIRH